MDAVASQQPQPVMEAPNYQTDPSRYKHWKLSFDGPVATLTMDVARRWRDPARLQTEAQFL